MIDSWCYTELMPTTYPRITNTLTPTLERTLAEGSAVWPGLSRSEVLVRLAEQGAQSLARTGLSTPSSKLRIITTGHQVTQQSVEDALDADY